MKIKRLIITIAVLIIISLFMMGATGGCQDTESMKRAAKTQESENNGGLKRVLTIYSYDGKKIKTYEGKFDIEYTEGGKILFDLDGKRHIIYNAVAVCDEK